MRLSLRLLLPAALAAAAVLPASAAATAVTIAPPVVKASWKEGWLTGNVKWTVTSDTSTTLLVFLRRGTKGKILATQQIPVTAGTPVDGTFKLPSRPLPGSYRLAASEVTPGGNVLLPGARKLTVPRPKEGVVDLAVTSAVAGGKKVRVVPFGTREIHVRFHFLVKPITAKKATVVWRMPNNSLIGAITKPIPANGNLSSFIRANQALPRGVWYGLIKVSGTVARRIAVRVQ